MESDARYHSISLELDPMGPPGEYKLTFSTMPGMSTSIKSLQMADLDGLADILATRNDAADGEKITTTRKGGYADYRGEMHEHDGYASHSHEVRADHGGVAKVPGCTAHGGASASGEQRNA